MPRLIWVDGRMKIIFEDIDEINRDEKKLNNEKYDSIFYELYKIHGLHIARKMMKEKYQRKTEKGDEDW